jgi:hypothetical protein
MIHEQDIRDKIAAVIRRDVSLSAFERWLNSNSFGMFGDSPDASIRLVAAVNLLIAELHDDIIDERTFRSELGELLPRNFVIDVVEPVGQPLPLLLRWTASNAVRLRPAVGAVIAVVIVGGVAASSSPSSASAQITPPHLLS